MKFDLITRSIFTEAAGRMEKRVYFITSEQLRVVYS